MTKLGTHNKRGRARMMIAVAVEALGPITLDDETRAEIEALAELPNIDENARFILEEILYAAERS